ncbi:hypothetical protein SAMN02745163_00603 [Clostridium cavendishii DSM 21758]|uniref:Uncharacterized protein n=1 Tax=Clostridium cavendishii DSM 21758 TaxID=1121302 RepID=A0A1M6D0N0_9CLOT|nr:tripartite tricarboxylate transporter TctB family protein [Clostridium cavendishii]SHI66770.1 hypothetical protein SAMN02745163_00603 [Clostridium cavendishii DSM 21758]
MNLKNKNLMVRRSLPIKIFLGLIFIMTILPVRYTVEATENVNMSVEYGIDGKYKTGRNIPLNISLDNLGENLDGTLEIKVPDSNGKYILYSQSINLPKVSKKAVSMAVPLGNNSNSVKVELKTSNKTVVEKELTVSNGRVNANKLLTGVLTDDFNGLSYFGNIKIDGKNQKGPINEISLVKLNEKNIGENEKTLECLDAIIIDNYDTSKISKEKYEVLKAWVNNGGYLILGTGSNYEKTLKLFKDDFLNGTIGSLEKMSTLSLGIKAKVKDNTPLNLEVLNLTLNDSKSYVSENGKNLINIVKKEKGTVIITNFDLATEPISSFSGNTDLWAGVIIDTINNDSRSGKFDKGFLTYKLNDMLRGVPGMKMPSVKTLSIIFVIYVLLVGPIGYFVLRKLNKRQYLWGGIPALAIIFAVVIYFTGAPTRINEIISNKVNFVYIDEDGNGKVKSYIGVMAPRKSNLKIEEPKGVVLSSINDMDNYGPRSLRGLSGNEISQKVIYEGNKTYFELNDLAPFTPEIFETNESVGKFGKIESNLNFSEGKLYGTIKNNTGYDIENILVMTGKGVWRIGKLSATETKEIKGDSEYHRGTGYFMQQVYSKKPNEVTDEEWKLADFMEFNRNNVIDKDKVNILAITNMPSGYSLLVNGKAAKEYDSTLITTSAKLNFKSKDGIVEYPYDYFAPAIVREDGQGGYDEYSGTLYGSIDMEFEYSIDSNINVDSLNIKDSADKYVGDKFKGEYEIYNYKEKKFEKIDLTQSEIILKDVSKYLNNNKLKIRVKTTDNDKRQNLPMIGVKGRTK